MYKRQILRERKALKQCYETCAPYVYTIIRNYIHDSSVHRDILQEVFISLYSSLPNYDPKQGNFKPWLSTIAIRQCIAHLRKKKLSYTVLTVDHSNQPDVELIGLDELNREEIEKLLEKMPEGYRTIFLLNIIDEYSHKEIAKLLKISPETSRSQLSRGLNWIRKNIQKEIRNYIYGTL